LRPLDRFLRLTPADRLLLVQSVVLLGAARLGWSAATSAVGVPGFRVHDLRHTAASVRLAAGADLKVVQRVLGHATAAMTMDLYGT